MLEQSPQIQTENTRVDFEGVVQGEAVIICELKVLVKVVVSSKIENIRRVPAAVPSEFGRSFGQESIG